jgi:hypothetical protein
MQSKLIEKINEFLNQENKENSEVQLHAALIPIEG